MRKTFYFILAVFLCSATLTHAGLLDNVMKGIGTLSKGISKY
jgi:predicted small secreted protein